MDEDTCRKYGARCRLLNGDWRVAVGSACWLISPCALRRLAVGSACRLIFPRALLWGVNR